ncbi:hypothetical protein GMJAKD_01340 [Candidatus Electrothrix aarhusensis]
MMTLEYNGAEAALVVITQKKGEVVFNATVQPGEQFSIIGTDKGTLGTEITISVNGSTNAAIHTSCSVPVGPGLIAGDFKVIEAHSLKGGLMCPVGPVDPVDPPPADGDCSPCEGKVSRMTLEYNGAGAAQVVITQKKGEVVFNATVQPGEQFNIVGNDDKGTLGTEITISVNGSTNAAIHTSCSVPVGPGLIAGDFKVIEAHSLKGGLMCPVGPVDPVDPPPADGDCSPCEGKVSRMTLEYNGAGAAQVVITQKKGEVVFNATVQPGEQFSIIGTDKGTLGTEITISVNGSTNAAIHTSCSVPVGPGLIAGDFKVIEAHSLKGGLMCPVGPVDPVDPPPADGDCSPCEGKVSRMTLEYNGAGAAQVVITQKKGEVVFNATVQPGEQFSIIGTDKGTLGTEITISVNGSTNAAIHTSCSVPVGPGLIAGDFKVIEAHSLKGGLMCPVEGGDSCDKDHSAKGSKKSKSGDSCDKDHSVKGSKKSKSGDSCDKDHSAKGSKKSKSGDSCDKDHSVKGSKKSKSGDSCDKDHSVKGSKKSKSGDSCDKDHSAKGSKKGGK